MNLRINYLFYMIFQPLYFEIEPILAKRGMVDNGFKMTKRFMVA